MKKDMEAKEVDTKKATADKREQEAATKRVHVAEQAKAAQEAAAGASAGAKSNIDKTGMKPKPKTEPKPPKPPPEEPTKAKPPKIEPKPRAKTPPKPPKVETKRKAEAAKAEAKVDAGKGGTEGAESKKAAPVNEKREKADEKGGKVQAAKTRLAEAKERMEKKKQQKDASAAEDARLAQAASAPAGNGRKLLGLDEEGVAGLQEAMDLSTMAQQEMEQMQTMLTEGGCDDKEKLKDLPASALIHCNNLWGLMEELQAASAMASTKQKKGIASAEEEDDLQQEHAGTPDRFFPQLSSVLHTTLRHVITPSSFHLPRSFPSRVFFHVYLINVDDSEPYDFHSYYNEYKRELLKLRLPAQEFAFSLHRLSMKEDTELALAYSNALRSAVVPTLSIDGLFQPSTRVYLDSKQMQHALRTLHDQEKGAAEAWPSL